MNFLKNVTNLQVFKTFDVIVAVSAAGIIAGSVFAKAVYLPILFQYL